MPSIKKPKYIYLAYVTAVDIKSLTAVLKEANALFGIEGLNLSAKHISSDLMVISITSDTPIDSLLASGFEAYVESYRYADILFSYFSEEAVYLYSLILFYNFEKKQKLQAQNFRRGLAYAAYDLTAAEVVHFQQSLRSTSIVLCSSTPIPDKEIGEVWAKTHFNQVTKTISFQSY